MFKTKRLLAITSLSLACLMAQDNWVLPEGTPVRMRIDRTISSEECGVGENVDFETLDDIKVDGAVVVPRGSLATATITKAKAKGRLGRGGALALNVDYVRLPSGQKLGLRAVRDLKGKDRKGVIAASMVGSLAGSVFIFPFYYVAAPAIPLFLLMHGHEASIPKGMEITAYTNTEFQMRPETSR